MRFKDKCYLLAHEQRVIYSEARDNCTLAGAHLVTIDDQAEQDFLAGKYMKHIEGWCQPRNFEK